MTYYKNPIMIVDGHMQYLFDETGKRYLDGFAGIVSVSVGHCHPRSDGSGKYTECSFATRDDYLFASKHHKLCRKTCEYVARVDLDVAYFTN